MYWFAHKAYSAVIRGWIRQYMKWLKNCWLSGSDICWWQFPSCFLSFPNTFPHVSKRFPNFFGCFPSFPWCFSQFLLYCIKIKNFGTPKSQWMQNYRELQKTFIGSFNCTCHPTSFIQHASLFFHLMSIHSFIQCQIKDEKEHAFASDNIRVCRPWW